MIKYKGGNGLSQEEAIVILGAEKESEGIIAQYEYLDKKFKGYELSSRVYYNQGGKKFDIFEIKTSYGTEMILWFDITEFYGNE